MSTESESVIRLEGNRLVLGVYALIVSLAAGFGAVLGVILPAKNDFQPVAELGPLTFPITPLNFAIYGAVMVGISLGIVLLAVRFVADRYDDA